MLYGVEIPNTLIEDKDELVNRLYKVIRKYVDKKLIHESYENKEDCVQDTIIMLLEKIDSLTADQLKYLNLERWIYNRMNSFVSSIWLGKLNRYRRHIHFVRFFEVSDDVLDIDEDKLISIAKYNQLNTNLEDEEFPINYLMLAEIISEYKLTLEDEVAVLTAADKTLKSLGFVGIKLVVSNTELSTPLQTIVAAVVDRYVTKTKEIGYYE